MTTSLITGIHGFIAKHLALKLKMLGHEVISVERETLENPVNLTDALAHTKIDYIYHLAAYGNHSDQKDEDEIIATNIIKTRFLLDATKNHNYKAFINVSSSSVYGVKESPMKESDVLETTTLYGASKIAGEFLARAQAISKNKPIVSVRPFSVYGRGEGEHRFIPTVAKSIMEDKEFLLDPEVNHDWIYVEDFVAGMVVVAANAKKLKGGVVNIGSGEQFTNREIVDKLESVTGKTAKFKVKRGLREYEPKSWVADISLIKSLGWQPKVDLYKGLKETVDYYCPSEEQIEV